jgi:fluoride ion exporter CrcB/FEX
MKPVLAVAVGSALGALQLVIGHENQRPAARRSARTLARIVGAFVTGAAAAWITASPGVSPNGAAITTGFCGGPRPSRPSRRKCSRCWHAVA